MEFETLPEDTQETIRGLKHGSYTIECDVRDALENSKDLKEFRERVIEAMHNLIGEAKEVISILGTDPNKKTATYRFEVAIDIPRASPEEVVVERMAEQIKDTLNNLTIKDMDVS